jgi:hypothetical protein
MIDRRMSEGPCHKPLATLVRMQGADAAESPLPFLNMWNKEHNMVTLTKKEQDAATQDGDDANNIAEVIGVEEMALLYVNMGGTDPRPVALVAAATEAGRIKDGVWIDKEADALVG